MPGDIRSLERARLGHHLLAGWAEVLGAAPLQGEAGGAGVVAVAQDSGFPAAEAPGGRLSPQPGPGAAPAGQAACCVLEQVPAEEHVDPGVAAAAEAGQQHGDGESHVGGLWEGKRERGETSTRLGMIRAGSQCAMGRTWGSSWLGRVSFVPLPSHLMGVSLGRRVCSVAGRAGL